MGHFVVFQRVTNTDTSVAVGPAPSIEDEAGGNADVAATAASAGTDTAVAWARLFGRGQLEAAAKDKQTKLEKLTREQAVKAAGERTRAQETRRSTEKEVFTDDLKKCRVCDPPLSRILSYSSAARLSSW